MFRIDLKDKYLSLHSEKKKIQAFHVAWETTLPYTTVQPGF